MLKKFVAAFLWLAAVVIAGELTELSIDVTKEIPASECKVKASKGDVVSVHYTGKLLSNEKVFDSSINRGVPIEFVLGYGQVIEGWEKGILGMCIGEERNLFIPSSMAYGKRGAGGVIPADADLLFETELVSIKRNDEL